MAELIIRPAVAAEADEISALALRSKGHWGYSPEFLERCRAELTFRPEECASGRMHVGVVDDVIVGFSLTSGEAPHGDLDALFVTPDRIGQRIGGLLLQDALIRARAAGFAGLELDADPDAVGFYQHYGARQVGERPSGSVPGRSLPRLRFDLDGPAPVPPEKRLTASEQRAALDGLADIIERRYVFPDVAQLCAREVRSTPVADAIDASELGRRLTRALRVHDRHFSITWGAPTSLALSTPEQDAGPAIEFTREGSVGVITIRLFEDADSPEPAAAAHEALSQLRSCSAAVVDVRQNKGGWPSMVELVLGPFAGPEPVKLVEFRTAKGVELSSWTRPDPRLSELERMPVYAVVSDGTASAAESFAYALQSTGRGTLVGAPTAGAANPVQSFLDTSGFSAYISTGAPIDPRTGTNWDQTGVLPDVEVDAGRAIEVAIALAREAGSR